MGWDRMRWDGMGWDLWWVGAKGLVFRLDMARLGGGGGKGGILASER